MAWRNPLPGEPSPAGCPGSGLGALQYPLKNHADLLGAIPCKNNLCYTLAVISHPHIWRNWAHALHRWGLEDWVAVFLESAGPLTVLGAQMVYLGQPLLQHALPKDQLAALAGMLEEPAQAQAFADFLREDTIS